MKTTAFKKFMVILALGLIVMQFSGCSDSSFEGKNDIKKPFVPKPTPVLLDANGNPLPPGAGGTGGTGGNFTASEEARKVVEEVRLAGQWTFDGCGDVTFDLSTGNISVINRGTSQYFVNRMSFQSTRADGTVDTTQVNGSATIPNWKPVCIKTAIAPPTLVAMDGHATLPVQVTGGHVGSRQVTFRFDDDGGSNTSCGSRGMKLPGTVSVDSTTFQFETHSCP
jgi:hypothetical protein